MQAFEPRKLPGLASWAVHSMHSDLTITAAMLCNNLAKMWVVKPASSAVALLLLKHTLPDMQCRLSICRAHETTDSQHGTYNTHTHMHTHNKEAMVVQACNAKCLHVTIDYPTKASKTSPKRHIYRLSPHLMLHTHVSPQLDAFCQQQMHHEQT